jgi:signal transduction histidine kinase
MRKNFLVKPRVQLLHLLITLGALTAAVLVGYFFLESTLAASLMKHPIAEAEWFELRNSLRLGFFIIYLILMGAIGIEQYLFFHSIIGPLFAVENALKRMLKGEYNDPIRIRDSDQLKELVSSFEDLRKKVQAISEKKAA